MNMIVIKTKNCGRVYQQLVKDNKSILKSYVSVKEINSGHKFHHVKCLIMISNKLVKHLNKSPKIKFKDNYVFLEVIILTKLEKLELNFYLKNNIEPVHTNATYLGWAQQIIDDQHAHISFRILKFIDKQIQ